jgi:hypothetical protein
VALPQAVALRKNLAMGAFNCRWLQPRGKFGIRKVEGGIKRQGVKLPSAILNHRIIAAPSGPCPVA